MTRSIWFGFAALCLLSGSGWALDEVVPGVLHGLLRVAVHDGLLAVVLGVASLRKQSRPDWPLWGKLALGAVAIFGLPQVLIAASGGHVAGTSALLVFLTVPVVVVFVAAQQVDTRGSKENPLRELAPALAGLGGAVLVVPFYWPTTGIGWMWLVGIVASALLAGVAAVWMHELLRAVSVLRAAAVMFGAVGLFAAAFWWVEPSATLVWDLTAAGWEMGRLLIVEGPILVLTVWLMREMAPIRFSARVLGVPLVMIAEGYALEHPAVGWTTVLGVLLLAGGVVGLLRAESV